MGSRMSIFLQQDNSGWSETHFVPSTIGVDADAFFRERADNYVNVRRPLMHRGVEITGVRYADLTNPRKVLLFTYQGKVGQYPGTSDEDDLADQPFVSLLTRFNLANGGLRRIYLRGIPDRVTLSNSKTIVTAAFLRRFQDYIDYITGNAYYGYPLTPSLNVQRPILGFLVNAGNVRVNIDTTGLVDGERMILARAITEPDMNRTWRVLVTDSGEVKLVGAATTLTAINWEGGTGYMATRRHELSLIVSGVQVRITKHNAGRPFGTPRGRSRRKVRRIPRTLTAL